VIVVEEPLARRADVAARGGTSGQPSVRSFEDVASAVEAAEERSEAAAGSSRGNPLRAGDGAGAFAQMLGAEKLPPNRADENFFARVTRSGEEPREGSETQLPRGPI
jgi:hypothetical protein